MCTLKHLCLRELSCLTLFSLLIVFVADPYPTINGLEHTCDETVLPPPVPFCSNLGLSLKLLCRVKSLSEVGEAGKYQLLFLFFCF